MQTISLRLATTISHASMRRTVQDRGEWHVCQGPKEAMRRQALASEFGRRQAAEEAGESPGVGERLGLLAA